MAYISSVQIDDGQVHLIEPLLFATAGGTNSALTAAISNFTLVTGACVNIKVGDVAANATLNVNSTGAKDIYYHNSNIKADMLAQNNVYTFVYDGTHWVVINNIPSVTNKNLSLY